MNVAWSENSITATGTSGKIGLFGSKIGTDDRYFFYMKFFPATNIATSSTAGKFRIWFEMGAKGKSEWHGVYFNKPETQTFTSLGYTTKDLLPISATATQFNANTAADFDLTYSEFKGQIASTGEVTIWHEVKKREQTTADQTVIRIERARDLVGKYDPNTDTVNSFPFNIIL